MVLVIIGTSICQIWQVKCIVRFLIIVYLEANDNMHEGQGGVDLALIIYWLLKINSRLKNDNQST